MQGNLVELGIAKRAAEYLSVLTECFGVEVYAPSDFSEVLDLVAETGRSCQTPMFSVARNDFTRGNAFWVFLKKDGECIAGCAAMYYDLQGESIEGFLRRIATQQYGCESEPILAVATPVCEEVKGRLIYIGELELKEGFRGKVRLASALLGMVQAISAMKWQFDWIYAFVPDEHISVTDLYGFTRKIPQAITWQAPAGRLDNH